MIYTTEELCELLKITRQHLYVLMKGDFPKPYRLGSKTMRWRSDEVLAWLEQSR